MGETGRVAEIRWGEHKKQWEDAIKKRKETMDKNINWTQEKTDALKSSFKYHMDHEPDFERGTVLSTHKWESDRINSEAIFITKARRQNIGTILNTNSGRQLDPVFNTIIDRIRPLSRPIVDDTAERTILDLEA